MRPTAFCPAGTYSASPYCLTCPAGSYCSVGGYGAIARLCPAGSYSLAKASACTLCESGKYSGVTGATFCTIIQAGNFPVSTIGGKTASNAGAVDRAQCPLGYSSADGSSACSACGLGFYADAIASPFCSACPGNRITPLLGATTVDLCVSIQTNYFIAGFALVFGIVAFFEYIVVGRFVNVALRRQKIKDQMQRACISVFNILKETLESHNLEKCAVLDELIRQKKHKRKDSWLYLAFRRLKKSFAFRLLRFTVFLVGVLIALTFNILKDILYVEHKIFYSSFILYRAMPLIQANVAAAKHIVDQCFLTALKKWVAVIAHVFGFVNLDIAVEVLFLPFIAVIDFVKNLSLENVLGNANVTCLGSLAPISIVFNVLIFGFVIAVIKSDFLVVSLARTTLCAYMGDKLQDPAFRKLTKISIPELALRSGFYVMLANAQTSVMFLAIIQYLMTILSFNSFFIPNGVLLQDFHAYSPTCSNLNPRNLDQYFAVISTVVAYLAAWPTFYTLSRICCPPRGGGKEQECNSFIMRTVMKWGKPHYLALTKTGAGKWKFGFEDTVKPASDGPGFLSRVGVFLGLMLPSVVVAKEFLSLDSEDSGQEREGVGESPTVIIKVKLQGGQRVVIGSQVYAGGTSLLGSVIKVDEILKGNKLTRLLKRLSLPPVRVMFLLFGYYIKPEDVEFLIELDYASKTSMNERDVLRECRECRKLLIKPPVTAELVYFKRLTSLCSPDLWIMHADSIFIAAVSSFKNPKFKRHIKVYHWWDVDYWIELELQRFKKWRAQEHTAQSIFVDVFYHFFWKRFFHKTSKNVSWHLWSGVLLPIYRFFRAVIAASPLGMFIFVLAKPITVANASTQQVERGREKQEEVIE